MSHPLERPIDPALTETIGQLLTAITTLDANPISRSRFHRQTKLIQHFLLQMHRTGLAIPQDLADELQQLRTWTARLRQTALSLSEADRAALIPPGPYCYRVIRMVTPPEAGHTIAPCPFLMGDRPDTMCFLNPHPWWHDRSYNSDAYKGCGINESLGETPDAHPTPE